MPRRSKYQRSYQPIAPAPLPPDETETVKKVIVHAFQTVSRQSSSFLGKWFSVDVWCGTMKAMFPDLRGKLDPELLCKVLQETYKDMDTFAPSPEEDDASEGREGQANKEKNTSGVYHYTVVKRNQQRQAKIEYFCVTAPGASMQKPTHLDNPAPPPAPAAAAVEADPAGDTASARSRTSVARLPLAPSVPPSRASAASNRAPGYPLQQQALMQPLIPQESRPTLTEHNHSEYIIYAFLALGNNPYHRDKFYLAEVWCNFMRMEFPETKPFLTEHSLRSALRHRYKDMGNFSPRTNGSGVYEFSFNTNGKVFTYYCLSAPHSQVDRPTHLVPQAKPTEPGAMAYTPRPDLAVAGNRSHYPPGYLEKEVQDAIRERQEEVKRRREQAAQDKAERNRKEMYDYWYSGECRSKFRLDPTKDPRAIMKARIDKLEKAIATPDGWREVLALPYPNSTVVQSEIFVTRNKAIVLRRLYVIALEKLSKELTFPECCDKVIEDCKLLAIPFPSERGDHRTVSKLNKQFVENGEKFAEPKKKSFVKHKPDKDGPPVIMKECPELMRSMISFGLRAIDTKSLTIPKMHKHVIEWLESLGEFPPSEEAEKFQENPPSPDTIKNWMKRIGFVSEKKKWRFEGDVRKAWK